MSPQNSIVYLDHAATSWPKPKCVQEAMWKAMEEEGANPGRGGHVMAVQAGKRLMRARMAIAELFHIQNPLDIAFTLNTTMALNMAIMGVLNAGDHVIATSVEHNSVRRPLGWLKKDKGISVTYIDTDVHGNLDVKQVEAAITDKTKLLICNHSSNLLGSILPVKELGMLAKHHGLLFLVDAAQSAGVVPIDVQSMGIDMLAFPGHKGLLGPTGTGGLYIHPELDVKPLLYGGTGSHSEEVEQPETRPDRYEAGTPNTIGIAGLEAGIRFIMKQTVHKLYEHEWELTQQLMKGLMTIPGVRVLGPKLGEARTGIVAFQIHTLDSSELAFRLDREFGIAVRAGYHCTPLAHATAGTIGEGAVRASIGWNTIMEDIEKLVAAVKHCSESSRK
ncbi:aminotransferase class V-fold PLP-dependent enzyme [Paenibacillus agilis]|uniref:cysteine desulfurase n=1 Tax=Paenibacillus agilis TaxID=3020863 RepID=A0A559IQ95_9BACL|nr:aminotransferase class V-fold PLP-dependent enzyme [Paenibacillus agilis]TVX89811.1 aminotransferase class V-fold PLP-dependent enzyme [Paenibacillus agilis]